MRSWPTALLILSLPVGAIAYTLSAQVIASIWPGEGFLTLLVPLFFAGLAMMPFLIPFFDRKAKQDLAEYRKTVGSHEPAADGSATEAPASDAPDTEPQ
jgi:hypothetical protein